MSSIIFDFPAIASRLRKDDFYTPEPKRPEYYQCRDCNVVFEPDMIKDDGTIYCVYCGTFNRCYFP